jgi:hypothetical protein
MEDADESLLALDGVRESVPIGEEEMASLFFFGIGVPKICPGC